MTATDSRGATATNFYSLTITGGITSTNTTTFRSKQFNSFTVSSDFDITAQISETGLPAGYTFTPNGDGTATITGSPSVSTGTFTINLTASNSANGGTNPDATQALTVNVIDPPTFSNSPATTSSPVSRVASPSSQRRGCRPRPR